MWFWRKTAREPGGGTRSGSNHHHGGSPGPTALKRKVFGVSLEQVPRREGQLVPIVINKITSHLQKHAMDMEGLFRVSGSTLEMNDIVAQFDQGIDVDLSKVDPHSVAGVLKKFFRELPEPLVPSAVNSAAAQMVSTLNKQTDAELRSPRNLLPSFRRLLRTLPDVHYAVLQHLLTFLLTLTTNSSKNKMSVQNIAICIVPSLNCLPAIITYPLQYFEYFFNHKDEDEEEGGNERPSSNTTATTTATATATTTATTTTPSTPTDTHTRPPSIKGISALNTPPPSNIHTSNGHTRSASDDTSSVSSSSHAHSYSNTSATSSSSSSSSSTLKGSDSSITMTRPASPGPYVGISAELPPRSPAGDLSSQAAPESHQVATSIVPPLHPQSIATATKSSSFTTSSPRGRSSVVTAMPEGVHVQGERVVRIGLGRNSSSATLVTSPVTPRTPTSLSPSSSSSSGEIVPPPNYTEPPPPSSPPSIPHEPSPPGTPSPPTTQSPFTPGEVDVTRPRSGSRLSESNLDEQPDHMRLAHGVSLGSQRSTLPPMMYDEASGTHAIPPASPRTSMLLERSSSLPDSIPPSTTTTPPSSQPPSTSTSLRDLLPSTPRGEIAPASPRISSRSRSHTGSGSFTPRTSSSSAEEVIASPRTRTRASTVRDVREKERDKEKHKDKSKDKERDKEKDKTKDKEKDKTKEKDKKKDKEREKEKEKRRPLQREDSGGTRSRDRHLIPVVEHRLTRDRGDSGSDRERSSPVLRIRLDREHSFSSVDDSPPTTPPYSPTLTLGDTSLASPRTHRSRTVDKGSPSMLRRDKEKEKEKDSSRDKDRDRDRERDKDRERSGKDKPSSSSSSSRGTDKDRREGGRFKDSKKESRDKERSRDKEQRRRERGGEPERVPDSPESDSATARVEREKLTSEIARMQRKTERMRDKISRSSALTSVLVAQGVQLEEQLRREEEKNVMLKVEARRLDKLQKRRTMYGTARSQENLLLEAEEEGTRNVPMTRPARSSSAATNDETASSRYSSMRPLRGVGSY